MNSAVAPIPTEQPQRLGDIIDDLYQAVQDKKSVDAESKILGERVKELELLVQDKMDEIGLTSAKGEHAQCSLTEQTVPTITNWDAFWDYIKENNASYMIQRRVSASAYADLLKAGEEVPGLAPTTIRKVNKRKV